ncbi:MAG: hypothetical protein UY67_C0038G0007 [Candidatus Kaiserbacteria bacterium GW2011_GWA2_52_12]|uniref:Uncharacterized protein n=1 Tax=Candidatus Kaiserbacteria bacterium GW2011_GWA2_52_12 TaxID=1618671 RepID=A0A0G1WUZ9_9BACT|nr:MAG: hypothetical protein UY67_C0038G0007 [Candidatus Kaiserbacteria bacterium GW2011_GWA2_52_12]
MNTDLLKEQIKKVSEYLESAEGETKQKISIISQYLSSLLEPEKFTDIQREDLRKLALELGYQEDTSFEKWIAEHK